MENGKVYLTLQNGKQFVGTRFGASGDVIGELVFTTGMTGYVETLTDPSYYGQIVTQTFPLIGNYGITPDFESKKPWVSAYIVREKCDEPSNFRCEEKLDKYLKDNGIVGVYGVNTRELTKIVRESGVMNAAITSRPVTDFSAIKSYVISDAVMSVTCKEVEYYGDPSGLKVVVWDFGAKDNIVRELVKRGCYYIKVPAGYTAEEILALQPRGLMLCNGPGDPAENVGIIENLKKLAGKLPIFGICLGHQLFALAMGGKTKKMKYGHRGANQPVKCLGQGVYFQPEPWIRGHSLRARRRGSAQLHQCQRQHLRRLRLSPAQRLYRSVPSRSMRRTAGCFVPLRQIHKKYDGGKV